MILKNSLGKEFKVDSASSSASKVTFTMADLEGDMYHVQIQVGNRGNAKFTSSGVDVPNHFIHNEVIVSDINPKVQSKYGNEFTITGFGFNSATKIFFGSENNECKPWKTTTTQINCFTRTYVSSSMSVIIKVGSKSTTHKTIKIAYKDSPAFF